MDTGHQQASHKPGGRESLGLPGFDPQRLIQILRRRKFYLILSFFVIGVVITLGLSTITPVFTADSRIRLENRSTGTNVDRIVTREAVQIRDKENLTLVKETLLSRELLTRVIRNLNLRDDPDIQRQAQGLQQEQLRDQTPSVIAERILLGRLRNKIQVTNRGTIFTIAVDDNDAHTAYKLCESLTQGFIDEMAQSRVEGLIESDAFTDEQLETSKKELEEAQERLQDFKRTRLISTELSANPVSSDNNKRAELILRTVRLDLSENDREIELLDLQLNDSLGEIPYSAALREDPQTQNLRERLATLEAEDYLGQLSATSSGERSGGMTPERQRIGIQRNRLIERLNDLSAREFPDLDQSARDKIARRAELLVVNDVMRDHESRISREYAIYETDVKAKPALESELRRLETDVRTHEERYNNLIQTENSNEIRMAANESGFGFNVRVLEPAKKPLFPSKPNKAKIAVMGVILALGIGLGAVFLAEYVDTSFKDVEDVQHYLGLEVVGTLPRFANEFQWERNKRRRLFVWRTAFLVTLVTVMVLFVLYYRRSTVADRVNLVSASNAQVIDR